LKLHVPPFGCNLQKALSRQHPAFNLATVLAYPEMRCAHDISPPQQKTPFGRRYLSLMQREPAVVLAHSAVARLLA